MKWFSRYCMLLLCLSVLSCGDDNEPVDDGGDGDGTEELKSYSVGDICEVGGVKGVVFSVGNTITRTAGKVPYKEGMAISVDEARLVWSTVDEVLEDFKNISGEENCKKIKAKANWENHYPALKWVEDKNKDLKPGDDKWYLPSSEELGEFFLIYYGIPEGKTLQTVNVENKNKLDKKFADGGGYGITTLNDRAFKEYWTSTTETKVARSGASLEEDITYTWVTYLNWGDVSFYGYGASARETNKSDTHYVRAVCKLKVKAN